ncbi:MAG: hypothetical protein O7F70_05540 [Gemmatimonadetes bacterium]|nr:hypothetical protein [Gemmatimonadota bacterium]
MRPPIEMTTDPRFARRVLRLAITSAFVLALIWILCQATLQTRPAIGRSLAGGWLLMPTILGLSLRWPRLRYGLVVPSTLVTGALLAICVTALPENNVAISGWLLVTGGVLLGVVLGAWFWFRWMPVPTGLTDPFSRGRLVLIVAHVSLIVTGLGLVGLAAT